MATNIATASANESASTAGPTKLVSDAKRCLTTA